MAYEIKKRIGKYGFYGVYDVFVDGQDVGSIDPFFRTPDSNRAAGYRTEVRLEWDALTDDGGFPNEYRTLADAKAAVADLMVRNGIDE